jgi:HD-GYP domain-containing protein (c-di-GMP phosphodiesterase class II)
MRPGKEAGVDRALVADFVELVDRIPEPPARALFAEALAKYRAATDADAGALLALRGHGTSRRLEPLAIARMPPGRRPMPPLAVDGNSLAGFAATSGRPLAVDDVRSIPAGSPFRFDAAGEALAGDGTVSLIAVPLLDRLGATVGVLELVNRRNGAADPPLPFPAGLAERLGAVNGLVAATIERANLIERITAQNAQLRRQNRELKAQRARIRALTDETESAFMTSVKALAIAAELHDSQTGNHVARVDAYCTALADRLGMPAEFRRDIGFSAGLHDVGKMSIDQAILGKRGSLSEAERREMERHTLYGWEILRHSERLRMAAEVARCHHERWDGSGYPRGLAGEDIPVAARFVMIADVYDALRSPRPYKTARSHEQVCAAVLGARHRFDPALIAGFERWERDFAEIYATLVDVPKDGGGT